MKNDERREKIYDMLVREEKMSVNDIIRRVGDSPATIRRDLTFLEKNGYILRTHGYAKYIQPEIVHMKEFSADKIAIARAAVKLVEEGDALLLDSGFSTLALAYQMVGMKNLSIVTNSIPVAHLYSTHGEIQTYLTGGFLRVREAALVGREVEEYVSRIHVSKLFLSTTGVRGTEGLSCVTPFQAEVKRAFMRAADQVILLIEHGKFDIDALMVFARFEEIDCIVTSEPIASPDLATHLDKLGVKVIVAK